MGVRARVYITRLYKTCRRTDANFARTSEIQEAHVQLPGFGQVLLALFRRTDGLDQRDYFLAVPRVVVAAAFTGLGLVGPA
jgi:hypothetical protein